MLTCTDANLTADASDCTAIQYNNVSEKVRDAEENKQQALPNENTSKLHTVHGSMECMHDSPPSAGAAGGELEEPVLRARDLQALARPARYVHANEHHPTIIPPMFCMVIIVGCCYKHHPTIIPPMFCMVIIVGCCYTGVATGKMRKIQKTMDGIRRLAQVRTVLSVYK